MIRYFTSRELSAKLDINLARWKRWSREFLPPDPLGGLQSGYARQYSIDDAFSVFLAGYLVSELGFSIPETKIILSDVTQWGGQAGLFVNSTLRERYRHPLLRRVHDWRLRIHRARGGTDPAGGFHCTFSGRIEETSIDRDGLAIREIRSYEEPLETAGETDAAAPSDPLSIKILCIQALLERFIDRLGLERRDFPLLAQSLSQDR
jgi:hypothetical protein